MLLFCVFLLVGGTSTDTPDIVFWNEDRPIVWKDFKAEPKTDYRNRNVSALSSTGIIHYRGCQNGVITYKIQAYFDKKDSWVKEEARNTYILDHERLHFDVTELHARKLRKVLAEQNFKCGEELEFENFIRQYINNWETTQQAYDYSTHHSMDRQQQLIWSRRIAFELSLLEEYKSR